MDNLSLSEYPDSLVFSKLLEEPISHNPFPYKRSEFINYKCLVCSSDVEVVAVSKISIPPISVVLRTEEPRCSKHMKFVRCSFCKVFFNSCSIQNSLWKPVNFPAILCPSHQNCTRCKNCGKWSDTKDYCQTCQRLDRPIKGKYYRSLSPSLSENLRIWTLDKMTCQNSITVSDISRSPTLNNLCGDDIKSTNFENVWTDGQMRLVAGKT